MAKAFPDKEQLRKLAFAKMPFGKFKDTFLSDIPEAYLIWFRQQGFPKGKLGRQMEAVLEMKVNGISGLLKKIRKIASRESSGS